MSMINNVIIIDDEPLARINLRLLIEKYTDWKIVLELESGQDLETYVDQLKPELVFMDIRMPRRDGIAAAAGLQKVANPPLVVFISAYDEYALQAFELYALDYLLKPFSDERFQQTVTRLANISGRMDLLTTFSKTASALAAPKNYLKVLIIRSVGVIKIVDINDVIWFRGCGNYVEVMLANEKYLHRVPMNFLEENLDPTLFARCHRSAIVRLFAVKEIRSLDDGQFTLGLKNGETIKLSQTYRDSLIARIEK